MSQLRYRTAVADPERALADLQAEESETAQLLSDIRQQIKLVRRILETQRGWTEAFGVDPDPEDNDEQSPPEQAVEAAEAASGQMPPVNVVGITPPPRRVQVLNLLGQDPTHWWKVRDIAQALDIDNQKSLRVLLGQLATKGNLIKTDNAWFRFNDGTSVPEPEATPGATDQGAAM
ncbi:hypothetical protein ACQP1W_00810 [Spirillospora sp. CA-255316]